MTSFSRAEIQSSVSKVYRKLELNSFKTNYFIIIGGAALILQDLIEDTEDVDISTVLPDGPSEFSSIVKKLGYSFEFTNLGGRVPLGLRFCDNNIPYSVGYVGIYSCIGEPCLVYKKVNVDGIDIPVRPSEFIKRDYEEFIRTHKDPKKITKIKERYGFLLNL